MEGGGVLGSGDLRRKILNLKYPRKIEVYGSLGQGWSAWFLDSIGILLEHEGTNIHGIPQV